MPGIDRSRAFIEKTVYCICFLESGQLTLTPSIIRKIASLQVSKRKHVWQVSITCNHHLELTSLHLWSVVSSLNHLLSPLLLPFIKFSLHDLYKIRCIF